MTLKGYTFALNSEALAQEFLEHRTFLRGVLVINDLLDEKVTSPERKLGCIYTCAEASVHNMGPTGIDSRCNASVSMSGVVGISRRQTFNILIGERQYALAA